MFLCCSAHDTQQLLTLTVLVHAKHYKTVVGSGTGVVVVVVRLNKESVNRLS